MQRFIAKDIKLQYENHDATIHIVAFFVREAAAINSLIKSRERKEFLHYLRRCTFIKATLKVDKLN